MAEDKYLDPIEDTPPEAQEPSPEPVEPTSVAEAQPDAEQPPKRPDTRPEGYVTKGERDRIAGELHQERQARAQAEDRFAKMVERFYKDNAQEPEKAEEDFGPDPDVDPVGALKWQREQLRAERERDRQTQQQTEQRTQQEQGWQRALGEVNAYFNQAKAAKPELENLYQGVRESFAKEYAAYAEAMGQAVNPVAVAQQVERQEAQIIQWAYQNRVPIDRVIENMAAARGVTGKAPDPGQQRELPPRAENGQFTAEAEKAAKIAQSQERNASLGAAPGAPVKKMTAAELAKMPESEMWQHFESIGKKPGSKAFDREMGFR